MAQIRTMTATPAATAFAPDRPLYDERRPRLRARPAKAWRHFRNLLADKENTEEVFYIFEALPWSGMRGAAEGFLTSPRGKAVYAAEPALAPILDDHARLRAMPAGSLAHAYCDFMEAEGLTAQGLVEEFARFARGRHDFDDQFAWYFDRLRDTHDLLHILTGYGRDALGEACVLGFTYSQQPSFAHLFIGYMAALNIRKETGGDAPVLSAVREAQRLGKACPRLVEQSITELLPLPLGEVRRRLNITAPVRYSAAHSVWRARGVDPYDLLGKKAA